MKTTTKQGIKFGAAIFATLTTAALIAASGKADASEICRADIMATLNRVTIMAPVRMTVTQNGAVITSSTRHALSLQLSCGITYKLEAVYQGNTREREFALLGDSQIIIAMD